jgi:hypothetical protein
MRTSRPLSRTIVLAVTVTTLATACHSTTTSGSGPSTSPSGGSGGSQSAGTSGSASPTGPAAGGLATCTTASLRMTLDSSQADGAAGSTYYPIDFTNTSADACAMAGYPGVSFVTAATEAGRQLGAAAQRNPQFGSVAVRLDHDGHAHAWLQVAQAGNYPASACSPVTAHGLRIFPPDQTQAGYIQQDFPACALTSAQVLTIMPLRSGEGTRGTAP